MEKTTNTARRVIVTGGSRGIGAACVRRFAAQGDNVVFLYHTQTEAAARLSAETGAFALKTDLSDPAEASAAMRQAIDFLGGVDVLVNNAGISDIRLFTETSDADWARMLSTNLSSAFVCSREAAAYMIREKYGRLINISSMWGLVGASCEVSYSAAKAGMIGMTRALAKELGPSGITVNSVAPGVIETDMNRHLSPDDLNALCDQTPLCRLGQPEEVAALVAFLAGDSAAFITGQTIAVDGGFAL